MDKVPKGCVIPRLPKVHKSNYPLRPVLSMTNSAYHSVAKFLDIEILKPLVEETKLFSIKDSFEFKDAITNIQLHDEEVCLSFDVRNLFTCIPVDQTIDLICDKLYRSDRSPPKLSECVLTESNCRSLLKILTKDIHFVFDGIVYQQSDGLAMGSPLSGSFSELFMNSLEEQMTSTLQSLSYYGRFADDTFLVARNEDMGNYLFRMFNNLHPSIKFTRENADHFLDIQLHRDETGNITSSVFRKETFTSLYNNFNSFSPRRFKSNLVSTLFYRAKRLCSLQHLPDEIQFLERILRNNGYPQWFIAKHSNRNFERFPTAEKKKFFFDVQYYGRTSEIVANDIRKKIERAYFSLKPIPVFRTQVLAPDSVKDILPLDRKPMVTYTFECTCGASYAGKSERNLQTRVKEHVPKWLLSSNQRPKSRNPPQSAVTRHLCECDSKQEILKQENNGFKVLKQERSSIRLAIQESVTIRHLQPDLCLQKERLYILKLL